MDKKAFMVTIFALVFLISQIAGFQVTKVSSKTIVVPDNYPTIQVAIDSALEGDTIYIRKGVYVENPVINKSISLIGEDMDATVIDVTAGLEVKSDNVTLTGFTIYDGRRGIVLSGSHCSIFGNKITDSTMGILLFGCENNSITENIFKSIGLSSAIQLNFANRNLVKNNHIDSCVEGIQIWQNSNNNTVTENTIINCQDHAIRFQYSNDNTIMRNSITNSGCGTSIYGSNRNTISKNNYLYNIVQFSANEDYYLTFGYNRSINTISENFWSDHSVKDTNGDGICDTPYIIDAFNKDNYPLTRPASTTNTPTPTPPIDLPTTSSSPTPTPTTSPTPTTPLSPTTSPTATPNPTLTLFPTLQPWTSPSYSASPTPNTPSPPLGTYWITVVLAAVVVAAAVLVGILLKRKRKRNID